MILLKDISKSYKKIIYSNASIKFDLGKVYFVLGDSGIGKTTLLNIISGIEAVDSGVITIDGKLVHTLNSYDKESLSLNKICYIKQESSLFDNLSIYDNLKILTSDNTLIDRLLFLSGLEYCKYCIVKKLSDGERKRVSIIRSVLISSSILLCDEPTSDVDYETAEEIMNIISSVSKNKITIVVSHDQDIAKKYADVIVQIVDGKFICDLNNKSHKRTELVFDNEHHVHFKNVVVKNNQSWFLDYKSLMFAVLFSIIIFFFFTLSMLIKESFDDFYIQNHDTHTIGSISYDYLNTINGQNDLISEIQNVESVNMALPVVTSINHSSYNQYFENTDYHYIENIYEFDNCGFYFEDNSKTEGTLHKDSSFMYGLDSSFLQIIEDRLVIGEIPLQNNEVVINIEAAYFYALQTTLDEAVLNYSLEDLMQFYNDYPLSFRSYYYSEDKDLNSEFIPFKVVGIIDDSLIENNKYGLEFEASHYSDSNPNYYVINDYEFKYDANVFFTKEQYDFFYYSRVSLLSGIEHSEENSILDSVAYNRKKTSENSFVAGISKTFLVKDNSKEEYYNTLVDLINYKNELMGSFRGESTNLSPYKEHVYMSYIYSYIQDYPLYNNVQNSCLLFIIFVSILYIAIILLNFKILNELIRNDIWSYKELNFSRNRILGIFITRFIVSQLVLFTIVFASIMVSTNTLFNLFLTHYNNVFYMPIKQYNFSSLWIILICLYTILINIIVYMFVFYKNVSLKHQKLYENNSVNI